MTSRLICIPIPSASGIGMGQLEIDCDQLPFILAAQDQVSREWHAARASVRAATNWHEKILNEFMRRVKAATN